MEFRVLGPLEVWDGGRRLDIGGAKPRAVLASLLTRANQVVSIDRLIDELWGETPPSTARNVLQCHVSRLRRALHAGVDGGGSDGVLLTRPPGYLLRVDAGQLDLHRFDQLVARARRARADGDATVAAESFREALALWRGPALADIASETLLRTVAVALDESRFSVLEERLETDLARGRHAELVGELETLVAAYPDRECLRRQLMLALYRSGRPTEALDVFRSAREVLVEDFGIEPGPALQQLQRAIIRADPALEAATPTTAAASLPPSRPFQLPRDIDDFTGREDAITEVLRLLDGDAETAVVISAVAGKAGVGKTAFAVRAGHRLRSRFPDGQLYVDLRGAEAQALDPNDVLAGFLRALQVEGTAIEDGLDERSGQYRAQLADRRVLVVLDNAASEAQVRPLLPGSPGCAALVTSRTGLSGLEAAHRLTLDVLDVDQAFELLARIADRDRVAAEPEAARRIVHLCGLLPLAVRVAGARLASRPQWRLALLAERLADERRRLDELRTGDLEVRASLALSYRGQDEEARRLFRLLGLPDAPGFPAWTAATLLGTDLARAEVLLERLVDAQLVDESGEDQAGQLRYRLHDLLRVYARERLDREEPAAARRASLDAVLRDLLTLAERAAEALVPSGLDRYGSPARTGDLDHPALAAVERNPASWYEAERDSLVAAVEQACGAGREWLGCRLATSLAGFFQLRGYRDDWQRTHSVALAAARRARDRDAEARVLAGLADLHADRMCPDEAVRCLQLSLAAFRETGNRRGELQSLLSISVLDRRVGRFDTARARFEATLTGFRELGWRGGEAISLLEIGIVHLEQGRYEAAVDSLEEARTTIRALGDLPWEASVLWRLGTARTELGDLEAAAACLEESLSIVRPLGDRFGEAMVLQSIGRVHRRRGDLDAAAASLEEALTLARVTSHSVAEALALHALGEVRGEQGRLDEAMDHLQRCLAGFREIGFRQWEARALDSLGTLLAARGRPLEARAAWRAAVAVFRELGMPEAAGVAARLED
jgi:DNA-binding SARP family transcriptional activator